MLTHSQRRIVLDELNHIRTSYNCFAALARKRFPESSKVLAARRTIKRLEKLVQRHTDRVEKFRKTQEEKARKLRADVRHSIEFDDAKIVLAKMKMYSRFVADA